MNRIQRALLVGIASAIALVAFAGAPGSRDDGKRSIRLSESVVVLGTTIPPGTYALSWTREYGSEEVKLEVARGRRVLARGKGVWIESDRPSPYHALVYRTNTEGRNELTEVRFGARTDAIQVGTTDGSQAEERQAKAEGK